MALHPNRARTTTTMSRSKPIPKDGVMLYVRKHKVVVIDESVVHIHHTKTCEKPCEKVKEITDYLEAELFVKEGYSVSEA